MRQVAELTLFGALAIGLHIAVMADWPEQGADASGAGGDALVTLTGASTQIETMVANWTRPPRAHPVPTVPAPRAPGDPALLPMGSVRMDDAPNTDLKIAALHRPYSPAAPTPDTEPAIIAQPDPDPVPHIKPRLRPQPKAESAKPKRDAAPDTTARRASVGSAAQTAAGSGGSDQAGKSGQARVASLSPGREASLVSRWGAQIRTRIERRKQFPKGTRARGKVLLKVTISRTGQLQGVAVRRSSGHSALDAAAIAAVKRVGRFPAAPKQLKRAVFVFSLPIEYGR